VDKHTTIAVDLSKTVFEIAVSDQPGASANASGRQDGHGRNDTSFQGNSVNGSRPNRESERLFSGAATPRSGLGLSEASAAARRQGPGAVYDTRLLDRQLCIQRR